MSVETRETPPTIAAHEPTAEAAPIEDPSAERLGPSGDSRVRRRWARDVKEEEASRRALFGRGALKLVGAAVLGSAGVSFLGFAAGLALVGLGAALAVSLWRRRSRSRPGATWRERWQAA